MKNLRAIACGFLMVFMSAGIVNAQMSLTAPTEVIDSDKGFFADAFNQGVIQSDFELNNLLSIEITDMNNTAVGAMTNTEVTVVYDSTTAATTPEDYEFVVYVQNAALGIVTVNTVIENGFSKDGNSVAFDSSGTAIPVVNVLAELDEVTISSTAIGAYAQTIKNFEYTTNLSEIADLDTYFETEVDNLAKISADTFLENVSLITGSTINTSAIGTYVDITANVRPYVSP